MDSAGAGGRWLEFISRSWIATSIRNFAAVAIRLSLHKAVWICQTTVVLDPSFRELIERA